LEKSKKFFKKTNLRMDVTSLPPELRAKVYKYLDTKSLINYGETHPELIQEILHYSKNLWWDNIKQFKSIIWINKLAATYANQKLDGMTALHYIVADTENDDDDLDIMQILINNGAELETRNNKGETPLLMTVNDDEHDAHINFDKLTLLLACGSDVNAVDEEGQGQTILHRILLNNHPPSKFVVKILSMFNVDVNKKNYYNKSPLHYADAEHVQSLVDAGADVDAQDGDGMTPLHHAVQDDEWNKIMALIKAGANLDVQDYDGWTVLHFASEEPELFEFLLQKGANVDKLLQHCQELG
jgi:ankyrin repeat protein